MKTFNAIMWLLFLLLFLLISGTMLALAHDLCINSICRGSSDEEECEVVKAIPREAGYFLPATREFIPASWALPSPDEHFHRCTYPLNKRWATPGYAPAYPGAQYENNGPMIERQGPEAWVIVPNNGTIDGRPRTRCFWAPLLTN